MVGRAKPANKAEKERLSNLHRLPCLCCEIIGIDQPFPTEAHHLLSGGRRIGHMASVNICSWHHVGRTKPKWNDAEMTVTYGPSLALGSRLFHSRFGEDSELLARANEMLANLCEE